MTLYVKRNSVSEYLGNHYFTADAVIFAVDVKPMKVGIIPTHGNLNRVMKIGNTVVGSQEQSPPDHWANAT